MIEEEAVPEVEIEQGIPVAEMPSRKRKYPWLEMKIGDSFLIDQDSLGGARSSLNALRRKDPTVKNLKFVQRTVADGVRWWRTE